MKLFVTNNNTYRICDIDTFALINVKTLYIKTINMRIKYVQLENVSNFILVDNIHIIILLLILVRFHNNRMRYKLYYHILLSS